MGARVIEGIVSDPQFKWVDVDTDAFNADVIAKYRKLSEEEVQKLFEIKRQDMIRLVQGVNLTLKWM